MALTKGGGSYSELLAYFKAVASASNANIYGAVSQNELLNQANMIYKIYKTQKLKRETRGEEKKSDSMGQFGLFAISDRDDTNGAVSDNNDNLFPISAA